MSQSASCVFFAVCACLVLASLAVLGSEAGFGPINGQPFPQTSDDREGAYRFCLIGHLYGSPNNSHSVYPASSFCASLPEVLALRPSFWILLGDMTYIPDDLRIGNLKAVLSRVNVPVFNAPGNHDGDRTKYRQAFGETHGVFQYRRERFIVIDAEGLAEPSGAGQIDFLLHALDDAAASVDVQTVFVLSHKLIWASAFPWSEVVFRNLNSQAGYPAKEVFEVRILPTIERLARTKQVYWFSGDIGVSWSASLFWHTDPGTGIHFGATGLGDTAEDAILVVDVSGDGSVRVWPFSLSGSSVDPVEAYGPEYWQRRFPVDTDTVPESAGEVTDRSIWPAVRLLLGSRALWIGVSGGMAFSGVLLVLIVWAAHRARTPRGK